MERFGFGSVAVGPSAPGTVPCGLAVIGCGTGMAMSGWAVIGAEPLQ